MGGWIKILIAAGVATGGCSLVPAAAQIVQRGVVLEMSSGRRPVSGVEVRAVGAAPSDSDMKGRFELNLPASLPGDPLFLDRIYKQGFELVNREKVEQWNLSADAVLEVVLGRTKVIDSLRKRYYRIGMSAVEQAYRRSVVELEARRRIQRIAEAQYARELDSLTRVHARLRQQVDGYAALFARINRDELDAGERQALALLDRGDVEGAIGLYEQMRTDSVLARRVVGRNVADEDLRLLVPSLMNSFRIMRRLGDVEGCDSVGRLIGAAAAEVALKLEVVEWRFAVGERSAALDEYRVLVREAQTVAEIECIEASLHRSLEGATLSKSLGRKVDLLQDRINARMNWAKIKENSWTHD